jgi:hypothetical protein
VGLPVAGLILLAGAYFTWRLLQTARDSTVFTWRGADADERTSWSDDFDWRGAEAKYRGRGGSDSQ